MKNLFLLFLATFGAVAAFGTPNCAPPLSYDQFHKTVLEVRETYFPELEGEEIMLESLNSGAYFLQARPTTLSVLRKPEKRTYKIFVNPRLLDCPPTDAGLRAIVVHELEHIKDYTSFSGVKILSFLSRYVGSLKFKAHYERATDQKVLEKGLGLGLVDYRNWVYQWLSQKDYERKRFIYFTPEEILSGSSEDGNHSHRVRAKEGQQ